MATHCLKQLNIIDTGQSVNNKFSSVLNMMIRCKTSMGKRRLKDLILHPSTDVDYLNNEYQIMEYVNENISPKTILEYRKEVPFVEDDRILHHDIQKSVEFIA